MMDKKIILEHKIELIPITKITKDKEKIVVSTWTLPVVLNEINDGEHILYLIRNKP